ncbi:MAG: carboxypeptidase regulatory-like domain-containing protein [Anaerolineae bacterium]
MKPTRILIGSGVLLLLLFGLWGPGDLVASGPAATTESVLYQLLTNPGMEFYDPPYNPAKNCQVASGWERFWYDGEDPCFMDTRVFAATVGSGWVERIEGETSQMIVSTEPYTAGIYQRVTGLTPGTGYGFHAAMLTIFGSSVPPAYHGMMIKQVGIDPTGGIDPQAGTVVWSEPDDHDEGPWDVRRRTAACAQGPAMTVFVRVISPYASGDPSLLNQSFLDSAILARTASVQAVSPSASADRTFTVRWENALPSPGGEIRWYDVQWMDEDEGTWHEWFEQTVDTQSTFTGERGHTHRFRARAWQRYPNGAHLFSPYRTDGDTETYVQGPELVGRVLDHEGHSVAGATVSISGTTYSAVSGSGGRYRIKLLPSSEAQSVTISHPQWQSPAPVHGVTFGPMEVVAIDWSLRPPDDAVSNGGFEEGLAGWSLVDEQGAEPVVVAEPVHTGLGALALGGSAGGSYTAGVTQTAVLTDAWEPVLSFWYRPETTDAGDDVFNVSLTVVTGTVRSGPSLRSLLVPDLGVTRVFTPSLEGSGWQHLSLYPLPEGYYSATVTIEFEMWNDGDASSTTVYLDEVDLAPTRGGPYKYYLPLTQR